MSVTLVDFDGRSSGVENSLCVGGSGDLERSASRIVRLEVGPEDPGEVGFAVGETRSEGGRCKSASGPLGAPGVDGELRPGENDLVGRIRVLERSWSQPVVLQQRPVN